MRASVKWFSRRPWNGSTAFGQKRCLSSGGLKRFHVAGTDSRLICLDEDYTHASGATPMVGDALFVEGEKNPVGVLLFQAQGMQFGAALGDSMFKFEKGQPVFVNTREKLFLAQETGHEELDIDGVERTRWGAKEEKRPAVFRHQPRDIEREIITEGWNVGIASIDALTPLGQGQSMLFTSNMHAAAATKRDVFMIDSAIGMLSNEYNPSSHCWFALPSTGSCVSGLFERSTLEERLERAGVREKVTLVQSKVHEDGDLFSMVNSYAACALAETRRDSGGHAVLVLPDLQAHYLVWRRAQRLSAQHYEEKTGDIPSGTFSPGSDRADLRQFYSALIQRSARLNEKMKGGTLSTLQGVFIGKEATSKHKMSRDSENVKGSSDGEAEYLLRDFSQDVSRPAAEINRIKVLVDKGVKLTNANLKKLGIQPPLKAQDVQSKKEAWGLVGPLVTSETQTQHAEELKSISDGHISMVTEEGALFDFDMGNSLTRIGIGINKNRSRDTRAPALRQVAGPLRLELCHMLDLNPEQGETIPKKAIAFSKALQHKAGQKLTIEQEVILLHGISKDILERSMDLLNGGETSEIADSLKGKLPDDLIAKIRSKKELLSEEELQLILRVCEKITA